MSVPRVSVHGGHSGEFCSHARDTLRSVVEAYGAQGFAWVGLTEHVPALRPEMLFPDEIDDIGDVNGARRRFDAYVREARVLQAEYRDCLEIFVGCESEGYPGAAAQSREFLVDFPLDYVVGSVHHVNEVCFDCGVEPYREITEQVGGLENLYCQYFDDQYALIEALEPAVVGHFDLIRLFDPDYRTTLRAPGVRERWHRNLEQVAELDLILDFNLRSLSKGADEPYVTRAILEVARELGIAVVPGDDSHGVSSVGEHFGTGAQILESMGFDVNWRRPVRRQAPA